MFGKKFCLVFLILAVSACSSERNTFTNRAFHNLTSHYNAFYLADTRIREVENEVIQNYKEDYTQILPVFIPIDSATIDSNEEKLETSRELASKAIEWHRISKWVDDSYYLLGKIDYLQGNFDDAQNTFKYVNVNGKDDDLRHQTLIALLRLYVDLEEYEKANFTIDYLSKEDINDENRYELYRTLAYYYESRDDKNGVLGALDKALEYEQDKKESSRINFILAQRYQREGLDALAFDFYRKAQEGNPPYERSFFAQLYAQQVAELNKSKDLKKVRNYYEDLYKDPKNKDLKDVVVYEMALFEQKQGDTEKTLQLLHQAAKEPGSNPRQKGYIYQKLAEINLDEFQDYRATKYYLDSALTFINEADPSAKRIREQKENLDQYVFHVERIEQNDSLLMLSQKSPEEQKLIAENFIKTEEERLLREAAADQEEEPKSIFDNLLAFNDRGTTSTFYFDNSLAMQQGAIEFRRTWGSRPLQDNWRRSSASFQDTNPTIPEPASADSVSVEDDNPLSQLPDVDELLGQIPSSPEDIQTLNSELEESYFELGKLLYFDLEETEQGIDNLETMIRFYPESQRKPEAYYLLYLAQKDRGGNSQQYVTRLNQEFPDSRFTFSVNNPDAASGNLAYLKSSEEYEKAYNAYFARNYRESRAIVRNALQQYPLTRNTERLMLLDIMNTGKIESKTNFRARLEDYIDNSQDSALVELAKNMLYPLLSEEELAELNPTKDEDEESGKGAEKNSADESEAIDLTDSPYKVNNSQTHIFVITMNEDVEEAAESLLGDLENFHGTKFKGKRLRNGNMKMQETAIIIISPFNTAEDADKYYQVFLEEFESENLPEEVIQSSFYISIENFQTLNRTKNIEEYKAFFRSTYK
ncbi:gliding motility protein [Algoriphagus sediminis]|uniref:Gliding motility protein n=1 Tax=Algoriphagus sediminis TaxID=3057113 RepID=A0ABT7YEF3_9BACT|nr:gliding motility protein [Algoriphagus sediminis]MDN3204905.1 gliding motility protein [Algoriphagus sediminis]